MAKIMVYLDPKTEEYDVQVYVYDSSGRLHSKLDYKGIKQLVIRAPEVRISRQLFHDKVALVIESVNPRIDLKGDGLLYIAESLQGK